MTPMNFLGTPQFSPISAHYSAPQSPRDDLESLCYTFIYLYTGQLPWKGHPFQSETDRYKNIGAIKQELTKDFKTIHFVLSQGLVNAGISYTLWFARHHGEQLRTLDYQSLIDKIDNPDHPDIKNLYK